MKIIIYAWLCALRQCTVEANDAEFGAAILQAAVDEFANHKFEDSDLVARVDALVDAIYYILDGMHRCGLTFEELDRANDSLVLIKHMFDSVGEFTRGAFELSAPYKPELEQLKFTLAMVGSELMEFDNVPASVSGKTLEWWTSRYEGTAPNNTTSPMAATWLLLNAIVEQCDTYWPGLLKLAFDGVHGANMRKGVVGADNVRHFVTKKTAGGIKVIKPEGWEAHNLKETMRVWFNNAV